MSCICFRKKRAARDFPKEFVFIFNKKTPCFEREI